MTKKEHIIYSKSCRLYDKAFSTYISPNKYVELLDKGWVFNRFHQMDNTIKEIQNHLKKGVKVKSGYMATSIRGLHDFYFMIK